MPGSKTYTSNKINELLEMELLDVASEMEKHSAKKLINAFFCEIIIICLSLLLSVWAEYLSLKDIPTASRSTVTPIEESIVKMETIMSLICVFVLSYLLIHLLVKVVIWFFSAIFNKRILPSEKVKAYADFHKKIINHIYLGISFENKFNEYVSRIKKGKSKIDFDLAANYLSQATHYFRLAKDELSDLIPTEAKRGSYLDRRNAMYLDYVGFPVINIALISGQRSLGRLSENKEEIHKYVEDIDDEANKCTIKQGYSNSLESLFDEIGSYVTCYQSFIERVVYLQTLVKSK